jgi:flavin-dependent dehydrogenase
MVLRRKFDNELVRTAAKNGAKFLDGVKVIDIKFEKNYTIIILSDNTSIKTSIVIGADGFNSVIARKTGLFTKRRFTGVSVVEEFSLSEKKLDEFYTKNRFFHIHLKIFGITGYGWVFPKKNHLNIGLGDCRLKSNRNQQNLKMIFNKYLEILKKQEIIPKNIKSIKLMGGSLPVWPHEKTYMNNVLLCGDAAGFINPVTGEGIYYALNSAEIAANITIKALKAKNTSGRFLSQYEKEWKKDFGKDIEYMLNSTKKIRNENEKFIQTMSKDKKLAEMLFDIMTGQQSIYKLRWKLIRRYLYASSKISLCNLIKLKK